MIELHLPYPPSVNSIWRRSGTTIHKSSKYKKWIRDAGWQVAAQKPGGIKGPYAMSIQAVRPDKRRRDLANLEKVVSDLLQSLGVVEDDSYAELISMRWVTTGEGVTVRITPAGME